MSAVGIVFGLLLMSPGAAESLAALPEWLAGCWERRADGFLYEEQWMQPAAGVMLGMSRTIVDGKLAGSEFLRIDINDKGAVRYVAMPSSQALTIFPLLNASSQRLVFENPAHDFPQRIIYSREGKQLLARIEGVRHGELRRVDFEMQQAECPQN